MAARAIGRLTLTPPLEDEEELEELLEDVELDVEEDEDEDEEGGSDPPPPQAGRRAALASASMPLSNTDAARRSRVRTFIVELRLLDRAFLRISSLRRVVVFVRAQCAAGGASSSSARAMPELSLALRWPPISCPPDRIPRA